MNQVQTDRPTSSPSAHGGLQIFASNVTGTHEVPVDVGPGLSAGDVANSIVSLMSLPADVPWALRDDGSSAYLDSERPIGDQIEPGARVTITPKTHLG
jgi:hypothetical protein